MKKLINKLMLAALLCGLSTYANALLVEQYLGFQSNDVNTLKNYAANNTADYSENWDVIDFTDDPLGFAGAIPGSNPWPAETATGLSGTSSSVNNNFFAVISGDFNISTADTYTFRTFNDDGLFLFVDDILTLVMQVITQKYNFRLINF